ncbi:decaprenylphosphoryl-beta-D-ribose oxidase [Nocardioides sp. Root1257]|uniref:FAD-binding oxidoreductase n=1 Tax=unclassified Nocardioides TaxID=2615069 RepID=UPI0006F2D778|nr:MULTISPECIES: FAD-binding oxidoreductase [unclassified Nocardioides]KQW53276.1 decaprenylphosphoryl-beta-D-ribose oxidase [Nocardioides sp. Root1257]KRC55962.1 decaprenylphosphoryl-beta-D-ribose oxidase [Nocardioides sp. Root224]
MSEQPEVLSGWGRTAPTAGRVRRNAGPDAVADLLRGAGPRGLIARGLGRSYGDAAQNAGGVVLDPLPAVIDEPAADGSVRVSAGTSLHDLMRFLLPRGRFVPVTPGTRYVTVGGAIGCDVHGKSHHVTGSFGDQVVSLDLVLPDGTARTVGPDRDPELYWATVGGMGLTGVIVSAVLRTIPVETGYLDVTTQRLSDLDAVLAEMAGSDDDFTYSVAWIDTEARGGALGRSVLSRGEHATREQLSGPAAVQPLAVPAPPRLAVPFAPPFGLVTRSTVRVFNEAWFRKAPRFREGEIQSISAFFHPLDGVAHWNRLYGPHGFLQYQFVVPEDRADVVRRILEQVSGDRHTTFLAVLKRFGPGGSGWLSFPSAGWTLAVDAPAGPGLIGLLDRLDEQVAAAGGRIYLAKDARVRPELMTTMYPRLPEFRELRERLDPDRRLQSDLSRRLDL